MEIQRATIPRRDAVPALPRPSLRFEVKFEDVSNTVSYRKLLREAQQSQPQHKASVPEAPPGANPALEARLGPTATGPPATKEGALALGSNADPLAPPPNRFSAVIEKIERLYKGQESDDETRDVPGDEEIDEDQYDTDDSFIDDAELDEYFREAQGKAKHSGYFVNKGQLEQVDAPLEAEPRAEVPKKRKRRPKVSSNEGQIKEAPERKKPGASKLHAGNKPGKGLGRGAPGVPRKKRVNVAEGEPAQGIKGTAIPAGHDGGGIMPAEMAGEVAAWSEKSTRSIVPLSAGEARGASLAPGLGFPPSRPAWSNLGWRGVARGETEQGVGKLAGGSQHAGMGADQAVRDGNGGATIPEAKNLQNRPLQKGLIGGGQPHTLTNAGNVRNAARGLPQAETSGPVVQSLATTGGTSSVTFQAAAQKRKQVQQDPGTSKKLKMEARQAGENASKGKTAKPSSLEEMVSSPTVHQEPTSSRKPGGNKTLERAIGELQTLVGTIQVPAADDVSRENSDPGSSQTHTRMPRMSKDVKATLGKVARLATKEQDRVPAEVVERLTEIMKPLMQPINLKKHLKNMVEKGNDARERREQKLQTGKASLAELVKARVELIQAEGGVPLETKVANRGEKSEGGTNARFKWDAATEEQLCLICDQYLEETDEHKGLQSRRLYTDLAKLWPDGWMDSAGIRSIINRVKWRRKDKLKRKKKMSTLAKHASKNDGGQIGHGGPEAVGGSPPAGSTTAKSGRAGKKGVNCPAVQEKRKPLLMRPAKKARRRQSGQGEAVKKLDESGPLNSSMGPHSTSTPEAEGEERSEPSNHHSREQDLQGSGDCILVST